MMMSEFIERTGFEPMAAEYEEIEREYIGCGDDKDKFCREWKKNGGVQRLSRMRARRIEELEAEVATKDRQFDAMQKDMQFKIDLAWQTMKDVHHEDDERKIRQLEKDYEYLKQAFDKVNAEMYAQRDRANEAERQLDVIKEAFTLLGIGKEA